MTNRITTHLKRMQNRDARISAAKLNAAYASVMGRILREAVQGSKRKFELPKNLLAVANEAYDVLTVEHVPASEWGI